MSRLRILVLATSYPLGEDSCSGIFVRRVVERIPKNMKVTVVTPASRSDAPRHSHGGIVVRPFRYAPRRLQVLAHEPGGIPVALRSSRWNYLLLPAFLASMLISTFRNARNVEVIHANWSICGVVAGIVGRLRRIPVITTLRGEDVTRARHHAPDRLLLDLCIKLSARIVTVSPATLAWLHARDPGLGNKALTIPNGVESRLLAIPADQPDTRDGIGFRVLTVGSLIQRKGADVIIRAVAMLPDREHVRLIIVGDGPERRTLEQLAQSLGVAHRVEFAGAVAPATIADLLATASVFVLASHSEGRPNVILEAMAAGVPVVATDIEGIRDLIEHERTGLLFADRDIAGLAGHLARLCADTDLRRSLGASGRRWIVGQQLTWDQTARRYGELYQSLVAAVPPGVEA